MNKIKIRSYNAIRAKLYGKPLTAIDRLILMRSYPHVHTELQFSERYNCISFSSTNRDGLNGCRFMEINYSHPERWDTISISVTAEQEEAMYRTAQSLVSQKISYDLVGLMSFATPLSIIMPARNKMWCTEASLTAASAGIKLPSILIPDRTHPAMCDMVLRSEFIQ